MLKVAGHVKKHYKPCCIVFEDFKNRNGNNATFEEFLKYVETYSKAIQDDDERNSFKGDMLEILAEIFFLSFANDPAVGISNYNPVPLPEDYGVDGTGKNAAGDPCAIQVKYRDNPLDKVTYAEIARTYTSARLQMKMSLDADNSIFVFTSACDVTPACHTVFGKKVHILSREIIAQKIDNNVSFWNLAFDEIKNTLLTYQPVP